MMQPNDANPEPTTPQRPATAQVPAPVESPQRIEVHLPPFALFKLFGVLLCGYALYVLWPLLLLVFLALFLAVTLHAIVDWLDGRRIKHWVSLMLVISGLMTALGVGTALLVPALITQAANFAHAFPQLSEEALSQIPMGWGLRRSAEHLLDTTNWSAADPWLGHFVSAGGFALNGLSQKHDLQKDEVFGEKD